jgi:CheY-like chemotaxis protein
MAKILVIDDDTPLRRLMVRILSEANHAVLDAQDGQEGLALFKKHGADLVITDVIMPEKEGLQTVRAILRASPETKIIAISGGGISQNMSLLAIAPALGAHATLAKPFRNEELLRLVDHLLLDGSPFCAGRAEPDV